MLYAYYTNLSPIVHCFGTRLHFKVSRNVHWKNSVSLSISFKFTCSVKGERRRGNPRDTVYIRVDVYTRRVLDSCFRIRERGEKEQTRGSPVPRGLGVLSYLGRAAWWVEGGGKDAGPYLRARSSSRSPFSLAASPFESIRLSASSLSFSTERQRRQRDRSLSLFLSALLFFSLSSCFLHLIPPHLLVISTSSSRPRELTSGLS